MRRVRVLKKFISFTTQVQYGHIVQGVRVAKGISIYYDYFGNKILY